MVYFQQEVIVMKENKKKDIQYCDAMGIDLTYTVSQVIKHQY